MSQAKEIIGRELSNFRQWRDTVCDIVVGLDCFRDKNEPFSGRIESRTVRDMNLIRVTASAHRVSRNKRRVAQGREEFVLLSHMRQGKGVIAQNDREAVLRPGDFAIYDTTNPYDMALEGPFEMDVLRIERSTFSRFVGDISDSTATLVSGANGIGRICSRMITAIAHELNAIDDLSLRQLNQSLLGMVSAGLQEASGKAARCRTYQQHALIERAAQIVDQELANEALNCELVADRLGISYRYLLKVFAQNNRSLHDFIWDQRLKEARRRLTSEYLVGKTISTIAYDCGFKDATHFSRAFRKRFGQSPR